MIQSRLAKAIRDAIAPMISRPPYLQVAALCLRDKAGKRQVLLVRSLGTGRWILPKGWPMKGRTLAQAALQEAWEEAGVSGTVTEEPLGSYFYHKINDAGIAMPTDVHVFPVHVEKLSETFPESDRRKRKWVPLRRAAELVAEPELKALLRAL